MLYELQKTGRLDSKLTGLPKLDSHADWRNISNIDLESLLLLPLQELS